MTEVRQNHGNPTFEDHQQLVASLDRVIVSLKSHLARFGRDGQIEEHAAALLDVVTLYRGIIDFRND
jgi:hypothetical protein